MTNSEKRIEPTSRVFGFDRGKPIDRYYIEEFLRRYRADICGQVLEIGDSQYTRMFPNDLITSSAVLHVSTDEAPNGAIKGDLQTGDGLQGHAFDCIILTQTLNVIYDVNSAIRNVHSLLKPGGVLLCTVPGISQISRYDMDRWGDYWRFTSLSVKRLFSETFKEENIQIKTYGNVYTSSSFLYGLSAEELTPAELDFKDPDYEMLIAVRACQPDA